MQEGSISTHVTKIAEQLAMIDESVEDKNLIPITLNSLSRSYHNFRTIHDAYIE